MTATPALSSDKRFEKWVHPQLWIAGKVFRLIRLDSIAVPVLSSPIFSRGGAIPLPL